MAGIGWIGLQSGKRGGGGGRLRIEKTKKYFSAFLFFFGGRKGISFVCAIVVCFCTFIAAFVKFVSLLLESCTTPCSPPFHERRCAAKTGPTQQHPHKIEGEKKKIIWWVLLTLDTYLKVNRISDENKYSREEKQF